MQRIDHLIDGKRVGAIGPGETTLPGVEGATVPLIVAEVDDLTRIDRVEHDEGETVVAVSVVTDESDRTGDESHRYFSVWKKDKRKP